MNTCNNSMPILPIHTYRPGAGVMAIEVDRDRLERIAKNSLAAPIYLGHTPSDRSAPEPTAIGKVHHLRIGAWQGTLTLLADACVEPRYADEAGTYPHRSAEVLYDHSAAGLDRLHALALLRRKPRHSMGLVTRWGQPARYAATSAVDHLPAGVLLARYSFIDSGASSTMSATTPPPRLQPEDRKLFQEYYKRHMSNPGRTLDMLEQEFLADKFTRAVYADADGKPVFTDDPTPPAEAPFTAEDRRPFEQFVGLLKRPIDPARYQDTMREYLQAKAAGKIAIRRGNLVFAKPGVKAGQPAQYAEDPGHNGLYAARYAEAFRASSGLVLAHG